MCLSFKIYCILTPAYCPNKLILSIIGSSYQNTRVNWHVLQKCLKNHEVEIT